jgi:hypothetical protein
MKATLIKTDNDLFDFMIGMSGELSFTTHIKFYFEPNEITPFEMRRGNFRSSNIESMTQTEVSQNCIEIFIKTKNSIYVFEVGTRTNETPISLIF